MKFQITIGPAPYKFAYDSQTPALQSVVKKAVEFFTPYSPQTVEKGPGSNGASTSIIFSAPAEDVQIKQLFGELERFVKNAEPPATALFWQTPEQDEIDRAKFLLPYYGGSDVETGNNNRPLNQGMVLCEACDHPNLNHVPEPFLVSKKALKKYDIFSTFCSILIVRQRVLKLLQEWVGDQILSGKAQIAKYSDQPTGEEALYWIRPKEIIGKEVWLADGLETCPKCQRTSPNLLMFPEKQSAKVGPGLLDGRKRYTPLSNRKVDIGLRLRQRASFWPDIVMSGNLLAKLKAHDVKGIVASGNKLEPQCLFSDTGESPLEEQSPQPVATKPAVEQIDLGAARKTVASLKDIPWDCAKDGYVYFHLSTPEFVVLDPMMWEEDSEGPYIVKNFKGPGLYRLPVTAIKQAKEGKRNVAVDSATLIFIDNPFFDAFGDNYDWDKSTTKKGEISPKYYQAVAEKIGSRFGVCTTPPKKFKSEFQGDGFYTIDVKKIERAGSQA